MYSPLSEALGKTIFQGGCFQSCIDSGLQCYMGKKGQFDRWRKDHFGLSAKRGLWLLMIFWGMIEKWQNIFNRWPIFLPSVSNIQQRNFRELTNIETPISADLCRNRFYYQNELERWRKLKSWEDNWQLKPQGNLLPLSLMKNKIIFFHQVDIKNGIWFFWSTIYDSNISVFWIG